MQVTHTEEVSLKACRPVRTKARRTAPRRRRVCPPSRVFVLGPWTGLEFSTGRWVLLELVMVTRVRDRRTTLPQNSP